MAYVRKSTRPDGSIFYRAVWHASDVAGNRKQKSRVFEKFAEARQFAAKMEDEVERRGIQDPGKHTIGHYFRRWIATLEQRGEHSPATLVFYRERLETLSREIGEIQLAKLTPGHLDEAYGRLLVAGGRTRGALKQGATRKAVPLSACSVAHCHRVASNAFEQARKWKMIGENPANDATPPSPRKSKARALSDDEAAAVWRAAVDAQAKGIIYPGIDVVVALLLVTGIRRAELLALTWSAIDFDAGTVHIRRTVVEGLDGRPVLRDAVKTESADRIIALPDAILVRLRQHRAFINEQRLAWGQEYENPDLVFPERAGRVMIPNRMTLRLAAVMETAGVKGPQPTHGFRHTVATMLLAEGTTDIKTISQRLGHSSPNVTLAIYVHGEEKRDRAAANVLGNRLAALEKNAAEMPQDAAANRGKVQKLNDGHNYAGPKASLLQ